MALQDLTPQLRTRLNRMERAVGWFIMIATLLLLVGLGYYIYKTAENRGWFASKAHYYTYARTAAGMAVGDEVKLLGFKVGQITRIVPMSAWSEESRSGKHLYVEFVIINDKDEYSGYVWTEGSRASFTDAGFLGKRELDLSLGTNGYGTYVTTPVSRMTLDEIKTAGNSITNLSLGEEIYDGTNRLAKAWTRVSTNLDLLASLGHSNYWILDRSKRGRELVSMWNKHEYHYEPVTKKSIYPLDPDEPPGLSDRMQVMVAQIQSALPGILDLTNRIAKVLDNAEHLTSNLTVVAAQVREPVSNLTFITANLREPKGSLGEWILPTNINQKLDVTLGTATGTLSNLDTNLMTLNLTLENLANITSNLNNQVQANTNMLTRISDAVHHSDEFIQGLKRFWLFRHLFAAHKGQNQPAEPPSQQRRNSPLISPKQKGDQ